MNKGYRHNAARAYANYYADTRNYANFNWVSDRVDNLRGISARGPSSPIGAGANIPEDVRAGFLNAPSSDITNLDQGVVGRARRGAQAAAYDARDLAGRAGRGAAGLAGRADNAVMGVGQRLMGNRLMTNNLARRGAGYGAIGLAGLGAAGLGTAAYRRLRGGAEEEQY